MRQGSRKSYKQHTAVLLFVFAAGTGCIASSSDLARLQGDVAGLNARQKKDAEKIALLQQEIDKSKRQLLLQDEALKMETKKNMAGSSADMDGLRAEFSSLNGRFEETEHLAKRVSADLSLFLEASETRFTAIEGALESQAGGMQSVLAEVEALKKSSPPKVEKGDDEGRVPANRIYKDALELIQGGEPGKARNLFKEYLNSYPDGPLAGNAQFWVGESYYDEKNYERAIVEYEDMIKKYPKGIKVPAALLKQAMAFDMLKDWKTAKAIFDKLLKGYPASDEAKRAKDILARRGGKKG